MAQEVISQFINLSYTTQHNATHMYTYILSAGDNYLQTTPTCCYIVYAHLIMADARKFFVGGNWKMNGSRASIDTIVSFLSAGPLSPNAGEYGKV